MSEAWAGLAVVSGARLTDRIGIGVLTRLIDQGGCKISGL
jgi:hypothetical protein